MELSGEAESSMLLGVASSRTERKHERRSESRSESRSERGTELEKSKSQKLFPLCDSGESRARSDHALTMPSKLCKLQKANPHFSLFIHDRSPICVALNLVVRLQRFLPAIICSETHQKFVQFTNPLAVLSTLFPPGSPLGLSARLSSTQRRADSDSRASSRATPRSVRFERLYSARPWAPFRFVLAN